MQSGYKGANLFLICKQCTILKRNSSPYNAMPFSHTGIRCSPCLVNSDLALQDGQYICSNLSIKQLLAKLIVQNYSIQIFSTQQGALFFSRPWYLAGKRNSFN